MTGQIQRTHRRSDHPVYRDSLDGSRSSSADGFQSAGIRTCRQPVGRLRVAFDTHFDLPLPAGIQFVVADPAVGLEFRLVDGGYPFDPQFGRRAQSDIGYLLFDVGLPVVERLVPSPSVRRRRRHFRFQSVGIALTRILIFGSQ